MAIPKVEPDPPSATVAAAGADPPADEKPAPPGLNPPHASLTALRSEGAPERASPFGAVELANTDFPPSVVTPAVEPFERAANWSLVLEDSPGAAGATSSSEGSPAVPGL